MLQKAMFVEGVRPVGTDKSAQAISSPSTPKAAVARPAKAKAMAATVAKSKGQRTPQHSQVLARRSALDMAPAGGEKAAIASDNGCVAIPSSPASGSQVTSGASAIAVRRTTTCLVSPAASSASSSRIPTPTLSSVVPVRHIRDFGPAAAVAAASRLRIPAAAARRLRDMVPKAIDSATAAAAAFAAAEVAPLERFAKFGGQLVVSTAMAEFRTRAAATAVASEDAAAEDGSTNLNGQVPGRTMDTDVLPTVAAMVGNEQGRQSNFAAQSTADHDSTAVFASDASTLVRDFGEVKGVEALDSSGTLDFAPTPEACADEARSVASDRGPPSPPAESELTRFWAALAAGPVTSIPVAQACAQRAEASPAPESSAEVAGPDADSTMRSGGRERCPSVEAGGATPGGKERQPTADSSTPAQRNGRSHSPEPYCHSDFVRSDSPLRAAEASDERTAGEGCGPVRAHDEMECVVVGIESVTRDDELPSDTDLLPASCDVRGTKDSHGEINGCGILGTSVGPDGEFACGATQLPSLPAASSINSTEHELACSEFNFAKLHVSGTVPAETDVSSRAISHFPNDRYVSGIVVEHAHCVNRCEVNGDYDHCSDESTSPMLWCVAAAKGLTKSEGRDEMNTCENQDMHRGDRTEAGVGCGIHAAVAGGVASERAMHALAFAMQAEIDARTGAAVHNNGACGMSENSSECGTAQQEHLSDPSVVHTHSVVTSPRSNIAENDSARTGSGVAANPSFDDCCDDLAFKVVDPSKYDAIQGINVGRGEESSSSGDVVDVCTVSAGVHAEHRNLYDELAIEATRGDEDGLEDRNGDPAHREGATRSGPPKCRIGGEDSSTPSQCMGRGHSPELCCHSDFVRSESSWRSAELRAYDEMQCVAVGVERVARDDELPSNAELLPASPDIRGTNVSCGEISGGDIWGMSVGPNGEFACGAVRLSTITASSSVNGTEHELACSEPNSSNLHFRGIVPVEAHASSRAIGHVPHDLWGSGTVGDMAHCVKRREVDGDCDRCSEEPTSPMSWCIAAAHGLSKAEARDGMDTCELQAVHGNDLTEPGVGFDIHVGVAGKCPGERALHAQAFALEAETCAHTDAVVQEIVACDMSEHSSECDTAQQEHPSDPNVVHTSPVVTFPHRSAAGRDSARMGSGVAANAWFDNWCDDLAFKLLDPSKHDVVEGLNVGIGEENSPSGDDVELCAVAAGVGAERRSPYDELAIEAACGDHDGFEEEQPTADSSTPLQRIGRSHSPEPCCHRDCVRSAASSISADVSEDRAAAEACGSVRAHDETKSVVLGVDLVARDDDLSNDAELFAASFDAYGEINAGDILGMSFRPNGEFACGAARLPTIQASSSVNGTEHELACSEPNSASLHLRGTVPVEADVSSRALGQVPHDLRGSDIVGDMDQCVNRRKVDGDGDHCSDQPTSPMSWCVAAAEAFSKAEARDGMDTCGMQDVCTGDLTEAGVGFGIHTGVAGEVLRERALHAQAFALQADTCAHTDAVAQDIAACDMSEKSNDCDTAQQESSSSGDGVDVCASAADVDAERSGVYEELAIDAACGDEDGLEEQQPTVDLSTPLQGIGRSHSPEPCCHSYFVRSAASSKSADVSEQRAAGENCGSVRAHDEMESVVVDVEHVARNDDLPSDAEVLPASFDAFGEINGGDILRTSFGPKSEFACGAERLQTIPASSSANGTEHELGCSQPNSASSNFSGTVPVEADVSSRALGQVSHDPCGSGIVGEIDHGGNRREVGACDRCSEEPTSPMSWCIAAAHGLSKAEARDGMDTCGMQDVQRSDVTEAGVGFGVHSGVAGEVPGERALHAQALSLPAETCAHTDTVLQDIAACDMSEKSNECDTAQQERLLDSSVVNTSPIVTFPHSIIAGSDSARMGSSVAVNASVDDCCDDLAPNVVDPSKHDIVEGINVGIGEENSSFGDGVDVCGIAAGVDAERHSPHYELAIEATCGDEDGLGDRIDDPAHREGATRSGPPTCRIDGEDQRRSQTQLNSTRDVELWGVEEHHYEQQKAPASRPAFLATMMVVRYLPALALTAVELAWRLGPEPTPFA